MFLYKGGISWENVLVVLIAIVDAKKVKDAIVKVVIVKMVNNHLFYCNNIFESKYTLLGGYYA